MVVELPGGAQTSRAGITTLMKYIGDEWAMIRTPGIPRTVEFVKRRLIYIADKWRRDTEHA